MRNSWKQQMLDAAAAGKTLVGGPRSDYPGEAVEHLPRVDEANNHPDFYAWHVIGRPDYDRLNVHSVVVLEGGRVEDRTENGLRGRWKHDENHGPWQATAPIWAIREFANLKAMMADGRWSPPVVVSDLGEGHLVHCVGIWDEGERIVEEERNTYYEATVKWSDGTIKPLLLWNYTGNR